MADRPAYWFSQALRNLDYAADSAESGQHDSACFAAQQAAELAVKSVCERLGQPTSNHDIWELLRSLPESLAVTKELYDAARTLEFLHLQVCCAHIRLARSPALELDRTDSAKALRCAEAIVEFCRAVPPIGESGRR
jgi:HEPN domain-containing protein